MPVIWGSTTASVAAAATAASAAVPPALRVSIATWLASGCEVAAMPSQANTAERPGLWKSRGILLLTFWNTQIRVGVAPPSIPSPARGGGYGGRGPGTLRRRRRHHQPHGGGRRAGRRRPGR